jgi:hypothetical protein
VLPLVSLVAFVWFFYVKDIRKVQDKYMQAQKQHNETIEKLLERIAKALEKRDGGSV